MRKYLLHVLIISFVFFLTPTIQAASDVEETIAACEQAVKKNPDYAMAYSNLGLAYGKSGMYKEAIDAFKQAIRIDPDDADTHYNLGLAYANSGMDKEAIDALKQAIRINPDYVLAHYYLGLAYGESGMYKEAISAYVRSLELEPDQPRALYNLGIAYYKNNELSKALKYFLKTAEQRPGHSNTKKWIDYLEKKLARPAPKLARPSPKSLYFQDITWGGGQFVIVSRDGLILTSTDGIEWVVRYTGYHRLKCVAWGNGLYVATGGKDVITSHDGIVWVKHHVPVMKGFELWDIAWVNGKFLAVGTEGIILTSVDGVKWTRQDSGITEDLVGIAGVNGQFMVVGKLGTVLRSPNASAWTADRVVVGVDRLYSVAWNGQTLVAVGVAVGKVWDGSVIASSSDQLQWEVDNFILSRQLHDVISSGDRFVAVGRDIVVSPDGGEWTFLNARDPETSDRLRLNRVAAGNDTYVAIGSAYGGSIFTSRDGITWRGGVDIKKQVYTPDPSAKLTLPNALAKTSPIDKEKELAREMRWFVVGVLFALLFYGGPVWVYIVLQIRAIYRTRGVWRIFAILAVAPVAFILYISAMWVAEKSNLWFLPLWLLTPVVIVYLLFLHTKFIPQRQKLTVLKCPKCDNEIRNPLEKGIPKGQRLEISCPKCLFSFYID